MNGLRFASYLPDGSRLVLGVHFLTSWSDMPSTRVCMRRVLLQSEALFGNLPFSGMHELKGIVLAVARKQHAEHCSHGCCEARGRERVGGPEDDPHAAVQLAEGKLTCLVHAYHGLYSQKKS